VRIALSVLCAVAVAVSIASTGRSAAAPKRCLVPKVVGLHLVAARIYVQASGCRMGRVLRVGSVIVQRRRVIAQRPAAGRRVPALTPVELIVSSGSPKR
jgi:beta-lactam-binding protein with PASTA domain